MSFDVILAYILARGKEPSTWAGIAVFVGMFGVSEDTISRVTQNGPAIITALAALVAIFASSKKTVAGPVIPDPYPAADPVVKTEDTSHLTQ